MFLLWINFRKLHLVWVLTSEMCSICLGHHTYGNLTLAAISSEIIHCHVSTVRRTETTWFCEYLHCREMISVDWLACSSNSLSAALSVATVLKSMKWIICNQAICCMTRRCERPGSLWNDCTDGSCSLPHYREREGTLVTSDIWFHFVPSLKADK